MSDSLLWVLKNPSRLKLLSLPFGLPDAYAAALFLLKRVTVHVLRHTVAFDLLQEGVDRSVIALWLGHESVETTQRCTHVLNRGRLGVVSPADIV